MLRFQLLGIPFQVDPMFWVFSAILGANAAHGPNALLLLAVWVACVFVSIVVHEMGHAQTARAFGASPRVRLYTMGGLTYPGRAFTRGQDLLVILGGPAAGLAFCALVCGVTIFLLTSAPGVRSLVLPGLPPNVVINHPLAFIWDYSGLPAVQGVALDGVAARSALNDLLFINLVWTLFNLLPIQPLDGGLLMRNLLGYGRVGLATMISVVVAIGCAVWALLTGWLYGAFFFGYLAFQNFQASRTLPGGTGSVSQ